VWSNLTGVERWLKHLVKGNEKIQQEQVVQWLGEILEIVGRTKCLKHFLVIEHVKHIQKQHQGVHVAAHRFAHHEDGEQVAHFGVVMDGFLVLVFQQGLEHG